jgi:hypothetical protein
VLYKITTTTSKRFGSGTDAKVHIKLYGEEGSTDRIPLTKSMSHKNPFEAGNEDTFEVVVPRMGSLTKIKIGHGNNGSAPGWHLKDVKIDGPNGEFYLFPCGKWLDASEDDGKTERTLYPENIDFETEKKSSRERLNEPHFDGNYSWKFFWTERTFLNYVLCFLQIKGLEKIIWFMLTRQIRAWPALTLKFTSKLRALISRRRRSF